ncbi:peptidoglycan-binding protein [Clostridium grantii]|uniref:Putative peptidoglycan binding domain-containing protein n=1 Tax=Clostridium grantii DSM 8605 TaxID=1121316 RepID=A0A1M5X8S8_9CLOT|nr:peptidoglycan-binding domain-containing protein [Clostridium grantii]SHH95988.1 Putative peptidoglycan binding domain-containing protein [Clostridium grantii DSM 8605]
MAKGRLQIKALKGESYVPIEGAKITIIQDKVDSGKIEKTTISNSSGATEELELNTPPLENSQNPSDLLPYGFCDIRVEASNFVPLIIKGCQLYPDTLAVQECKLIASTARNNGTREVKETEIVNIQPNTLVGKYPPKIPEDPNKILPPPTGGVVLPEPVVPGLIVVHAGSPEDPSAPNYTIPFKDYIKNVASCEIFATWPETTIRANVYCILSFTLNRIYTEWYRGKGKVYDITSSTAYDHAFSYGRNIYSNISRIVDDIFSTYLQRPGRKQPLLTQYCDGQKVQCPGWLTQWGSKYLGDEGKVPYEILTNFYGPNLEFKTAKKVEGIPMSYPGYILKLGSSGEPVRTIQKYLNRIAVDYPAIPKQIVDGVYGQKTKDAVNTFQGIFYLPTTGVVNYPTWYSISDIYVAVTKIAELQSRSSRQIVQTRKVISKGVFVPPTPYIDFFTPSIYYPKN